MALQPKRWSAPARAETFTTPPARERSLPGATTRRLLPLSLLLACAVVGVPSAGAAPITSTVTDPGQGGPAAASVPVVFRRSVDQFVMVIRFDRQPARAGGSPLASGTLNGYVGDAGGAPSFLHHNQRAKCFFMTFTGSPPTKKGRAAWHFPYSRPLLDFLDAGDTLTVTVRPIGVVAKHRLDDDSELIGGPRTQFDNAPVRVVRGPRKDFGNEPALDNRNAQRYLKRIGCNGRISQGLERFTGLPARDRIRD